MSECQGHRFTVTGVAKVVSVMSWSLLLT